MNHSNESTSQKLDRIESHLKSILDRIEKLSLGVKSLIASSSITQSLAQDKLNVISHCLGRLQSDIRDADLNTQTDALRQMVKSRGWDTESLIAHGAPDDGSDNHLLKPYFLSGAHNPEDIPTEYHVPGFVWMLDRMAVIADVGVRIDEILPDGWFSVTAFADRNHLRRNEVIDYLERTGLVEITSTSAKTGRKVLGGALKINRMQSNDAIAFVARHFNDDKQKLRVRFVGEMSKSNDTMIINEAEALKLFPIINDDNVGLCEAGSECPPRFKKSLECQRLLGVEPASFFELMKSIDIIDFPEYGDRTRLNTVIATDKYPYGHYAAYRGPTHPNRNLYSLRMHAEWRDENDVLVFDIEAISNDFCFVLANINCDD